MDNDLNDLIALAAEQERDLREARDRMEAALQRRNATIHQLRTAGASYGDIARTLGLTRAGAVGICRKLEQHATTRST